MTPPPTSSDDSKPEDLENPPIRPPDDPGGRDPFSMTDFELCWARQDLEQRLGFSGGRFTSTNRLFTFLLGLLMTAGFFSVLIFGLKGWSAASYVTAKFLERGPCQYASVFLFCWGLAILLVKGKKLRFQKRALNLAAVPQRPDFVINPSTARAVLERIHALVDGSVHFILLNRIERAISNLNNIGQIGDVATLLRDQSEYDEQQVSSSFRLLTGFIWAIPVIGFIGTVLGLSDAIGGFGTTLRAGGEMSAIRDSLQGVTAGLATAFDTTLVALVAALVLQLLMVFTQNREEEFLDACSDYCHAHVTSRLRLQDTET